MFYFLAKVLIQKDEDLNPADYDMVGVLGKVSGEIRPTGTGEIIFSQAGSRRAAPARSEDDAAIAKGTEVVVTRYERGIAYVRPWDELTNTDVAAKQN
jgi:membrane protein implicated in regulation of membrane protease activity